MYMLTYIARPTERSEHHGSAIGALVNAFIDFKDAWGCDQLARAMIDHHGWIVERHEATHLVERADVQSDEEALGTFDEAIEDGWSFVFHTFLSEEELDEPAPGEWDPDRQDPDDEPAQGQGGA